MNGYKLTDHASEDIDDSEVKYDDTIDIDYAFVPNSIQIASDIHLEFPGTYDIMTKVEAKSAVLALCGDIGWPNKPDYIKFLKEMSNKFKYVIVIAGNHEVYTPIYSIYLSIYIICTVYHIYSVLLSRIS